MSDKIITLRAGLRIPSKVIERAFDRAEQEEGMSRQNLIVLRRLIMEELEDKTNPVFGRAELIVVVLTLLFYVTFLLSLGLGELQGIHGVLVDVKELIREQR